MILTGGIDAEFAKSILVGRPEGTPVSMLAAAADEAGCACGVAAALVQDDE